MNNEIKEGLLKLENWLSDPRELGCKPSKIEYTNSFEDEDGIKCMIFKYKKSLTGKWMLGIVSDSGTFSEMEEYNKNTEIEAAKKILEMLKDYWKTEAAKKALEMFEKQGKTEAAKKISEMLENGTLDTKKISEMLENYE